MSKTNTRITEAKADRTMVALTKHLSRRGIQSYPHKDNVQVAFNHTEMCIAIVTLKDSNVSDVALALTKVLGNRKPKPHDKNRPTGNYSLGLFKGVELHLADSWNKRNRMFIYITGVTPAN